ncbi:hypothetical protein B0T26DRAFT_337668 [Lasiosphaeria miniovina]|uniref:Uncharacterized protein n=1 Tax=Lasiosphaeria miniovina TaxID=1954250 RepID=A0AA40DR40_9PEZI|nr:uncharacterized protein B0T26DRAFT_337668 [Lasiosphaeria miniovina]KAK0712430.1 hypothetical protein B0T26DRAFT_337668 [Lasiosphaeria miniovina]
MLAVKEGKQPVLRQHAIPLDIVKSASPVVGSLVKLHCLSVVPRPLLDGHKLVVKDLKVGGFVKVYKQISRPSVISAAQVASRDFPSPIKRFSFKYLPPPTRKIHLGSSNLQLPKNRKESPKIRLHAPVYPSPRLLLFLPDHHSLRLFVRILFVRILFVRILFVRVLFSRPTCRPFLCLETIICQWQEPLLLPSRWPQISGLGRNKTAVAVLS